LTTQEPTFIGRTYAILVAGFLSVLIMYAIRYAYGMLLPEMIPDLRLSKTQAGTVFAVYFIVYTLCSPVLGVLSDRANYRVLLTVFSTIAAVGTFWMAYATAFGYACLAFGLVAFGHSAGWAPVVALVQKWVPNHRKGMALSFVCSGVGVGILTWGVMLPLIVKHYDWRVGWLTLGFCNLGVAVLTVLLVRNPPGYARSDGTEKTASAPFWPAMSVLLRSKPFWVIGISYLLAGFNLLVPFTFLPVYAREELHLPYAIATRFIVIIAVSGIAGQLLLGTLSDAFDRIRLMVLCGLIMGCGCAAMLLARGAWSLYLATCFYGVGYGAVWPIYAAVASDYFSKRQSGTVIGLWTALLGFGSIVSPVVCGWTIDHTGGYTWTFVIGLLSGLLSGAIPLWLSRKKADALV
jgi:MFS family permease